MAPYTVAHMKLGMYLKSLGYKFERDQRLQIYLTNSLEPYTANSQSDFFFNSVGAEAAGANNVKQNRYFSVVLGNPPYSNNSTNKSIWIKNLIEIYKQDLNEKKINLDDDYIKFTRLGQYFIDKNGIGILSYISNNSFIDGVTHRQMRKNLLESCSTIYILDLHGNAKKKEVCNDGSPDQNVFDIMQGVSINIFVKKGKKKNELSKVSHFEFQGKRESKYDFLKDNSLNTFEWRGLAYKEPYYFFVPKGFNNEFIYNNGFEIEKLFINTNTGIQTKRDALCLQFEKGELDIIKHDFLSLSDNDIRRKYQLVEDNRDWKISYAKLDLKSYNPKMIHVSHRPFDHKWTFYTGRSKGFIGYPRNNTMKHMLFGNNYALLLGRQNKSETIDSFYITNLVSEMKCAERTIQSYHFPLYIYPETNNQKTIDIIADRLPNLNAEIVKKIAEKIGITFTNEKITQKGTFAPIEILDYIYAVLYSPTYREKYKEFLKIDFPRIPYPKNNETFWSLVALGGELRQIHLLESEVVNDFITQYPINGDNVVTKKASYDNGKVWINRTQYFENVPQVAWEFYIGGYQPAQKWLKDRKDRELSIEDIAHYQKIIVALTETDRIMQEIDKIEFE